MTSLKRFITHSTQPSSSIRLPSQKVVWLSARGVAVLAMLLAIAGVFLCNSEATHVQAKTVQATDAKDASAIDPDAVDAVKKMSTYLGTLKSFQVTDNVTEDDVLDDGKKFTVWARLVNYYATVPAPPSIGQLFEPPVKNTTSNCPSTTGAPKTTISTRSKPRWTLAPVP
jgi:hypothetical protein